MSSTAGWNRCTIGSLCQLLNGRAFKPSDWTDTGLPIVRIQNLNNPNAPLNHFQGEVRPRFLIDSGSLLFAWSGTPGTSFGAHIWNGGPAVLNQHIFHVVFDEQKIDKHFFRLAINHKLDELIGKAHGGVGLRHVTKGKFEATEIALPPLEDQRRIVSLIGGALDRTISARNQIDRLPKLLERYKQAVLAAAFQDEQSRVWPSKALWELITEGPTNGYSPQSGANPNGTLSLKLTATTKGVLDLSERSVKRLNEIIGSDSKFWLLPGDILIQRGNSLEYVGTTVMYEGPSRQYIYPDLMIRVRAKTPLLARWIAHYCATSQARSYFIDNAIGTAGNMPKISGKTVRELKVPLPPDETVMQKAIEKLETCLGQIGRIETQASRARDLLQRIDDSILRKFMKEQS